MDVKRKLKRGW